MREAVTIPGRRQPKVTMGMVAFAAMFLVKPLRFIGTSPNWHDRDGVILSNGHAPLFHDVQSILTGGRAGEMKGYRT